MKLAEVLNVIVNTDVCLIVTACGFVYTEADRNEIELYNDCKVLTIETTLSGKLMITVRA
ncbi:MAG: hypothetical protein PUF49_05100 [Firmicutes bacterium]|nr:hypothetical protein [Bacillota bacterium]